MNSNDLSLVCISSGKLSKVRVSRKSINNKASNFGYIGISIYKSHLLAERDFASCPFTWTRKNLQPIDSVSITSQKAAKKYILFTSEHLHMAQIKPLCNSLRVTNFTSVSVLPSRRQRSYRFYYRLWTLVHAVIKTPIKWGHSFKYSRICGGM